ncbi:MAG: PQQ-binding-like beta-propeller repeat protein [Planctomycetota bacterium]|nr:PQQ-binding-like beta-propeller repeat protein [Planctomycetota bacterium]
MAWIRRTWLAAAGVAACCSSLQTRAADWDQFRGPAGNGRALATSLPVAWSETENVVWKVPIDGKAWSSPVVADGIVWLTNATEDGTRLSIVALVAASGERLHDLTIFEIAEPAFCHAFNSYASPTPVVADGRLWVHYGSAGTACLSTATGEVLWTRQDLPCDHHRGAGSSPILVDGLLVLTFDGFDRQYVAALDASTGQTVWQTDRSIDYGTDDGDMKKAYSTPTAFEHAGRQQLVSPSAVATIAYDPATGDELWRGVHGGFNAACRPLYADGLVVICIQRGDALLAVRPEGSGDITGTQVVWRAGKAAPTRPSQCVVGESLYMVSDTGIVSCLDLATGEPRWTERRSGRYSASLIEGGGRLYAFDEDGGCVVFAADPNGFVLLGENQLEAGCMASPAVVENDLIVRTKTRCYRLGRAASPPSQ